MARLPTSFDLSGPASLRSGAPIASADMSGIARGAQQLGQGIASLGDSLVAVQLQKQKETNATDIISVDGPAMKELHDFTRTFDQDGDYATFDKRATAGIEAIKQKYAAKISDPKARQQWSADFTPRGESARNSIADLGERRVREGKLADAKGGLQSYQSIIADDSASQDDRDRAKASAGASIDALEHSGQISPSEAQTWRDTVIKGGEFVLGQREIEKDPSVISGKLSPKVSDRAGMAMKYFQSRGWSKEQAAGIVGNLLAESSLDSTATNKGDGRDGTDSIGIGQWNSDRARALRNFAAENRADWHDFNVQLAFVDHELNSSESAVGNQLRSAKDVQAATDAAIMYERPAGSQNGPRSGHNYNGRLRFAQQAAGETIKPDWYLSQSPDKQLQLERQADVQTRQNTATAIAQQKATAAAANDDLQLRIKTDPTLTEQQIVSDNRLDNGQKASLIGSLRSEQETNAGVAQIVAAIGEGKSVAINGFDPRESGAAEKAYRQFVAAVPEDQQSHASTAFIKQTGFIPKPVEADLRAGASSSSVADVSAAMQTASALSKMAPTGFASMTGVDDIRKKMDLYDTYRQTMGLSSDQAAEKIIALNDPEQIRRRDAILKSDQTKKLLKGIGANTVASIFDKGLFHLAPNVGASASSDEIKVGVNPESEAAIVGDYRNTLEEALVDTNGDQTTAQELANKRFQTVYGTTQLSPLSNNIVVRYPPEKAYPALPDGSHDYIHGQLVQALKGEGIDASRVYLQGDAGTEKDIQAGRPARYQVFYEKDGKLERFNLPFFADVNVAKAEYETAQAQRAAAAEKQMLENRAVQERAFPEGQGTSALERFGNDELYRGIARENSPMGKALERSRQVQSKAANERAKDSAERAKAAEQSPDAQREQSLNDFLNGPVDPTRNR